MEYVRLGHSGLKVSRLCLGTMNMGTPQWKPWIFDEAQSEPIVRHALEAGVNFIDLADFYSTGVGEEVVGRILERLARREEIVVTTKVGYDMGAYQNAGGHSRKHIMDGIDGSLTRLGMDYVDIYMLHYFDVNTPVEETMGALERYRALGQGALYRRLDDVHVAVREDHAGLRAPRLAQADQHAIAVEPRVPRGRARNDAVLRGSGRRRVGVQPAGARSA